MHESHDEHALTLGKKVIFFVLFCVLTYAGVAGVMYYEYEGIRTKMNTYWVSVAKETASFFHAHAK